MSPPQRLKALTGHLVPTTAPVAGGPEERAAPLAGITVLEVANWIAAPCCGAMMAAMGAEVIKVEPPFGDGMRYVLRQHGHDGRPQTRDEIGTFPDIHFNQENSSKKGIAVALDMDEGQQVVHRLLEQADVMITNLLPDRLNRYSLDFETVHRINPSVVIASVSSYGLEGPSADWPGFDVGALFARGGHASLHGTEKFLSRAGYGDHCAGLSILSATLGALMMRQQTGKGTVVSTSLLRLSQWMIASDMAPALNDGMQPTSAMDALQVPEGGLPDGLPVSSGTYRTADDRWIRLTGATKMPALLKGIGLEELLSDPRYGGGRMDPDVKAELTERIQAAFATRTLEEWKQSGDLDATFYSPMSTLPEVAVDPQVLASGAFTTLSPGPRGGADLKLVNLPFAIENADVRVRHPAPDVGEHTDEVLLRAGLSSEEVEQLRSIGAVGARPAPGSALEKWMSLAAAGK